MEDLMKHGSLKLLAAIIMLEIGCSEEDANELAWRLDSQLEDMIRNEL